MYCKNIYSFICAAHEKKSRAHTYRHKFVLYNIHKTLYIRISIQQSAKLARYRRNRHLNILLVHTYIHMYIPTCKLTWWWRARHVKRARHVPDIAECLWVSTHIHIVYVYMCICMYVLTCMYAWILMCLIDEQLCNSIHLMFFTHTHIHLSQHPHTGSGCLKTSTWLHAASQHQLSNVAGWRLTAVEFIGHCWWTTQQPNSPPDAYWNSMNVVVYVCVCVCVCVGLWLVWYCKFTALEGIYVVCSQELDSIWRCLVSNTTHSQQCIATAITTTTAVTFKNHIYLLSMQCLLLSISPPVCWL